MTEDRAPIHAVLLIATIGAEPQVVSLATQLLLQQGIDCPAIRGCDTHQTDRTADSLFIAAASQTLCRTIIAAANAHYRSADSRCFDVARIGALFADTLKRIR